MPDVPERAVLDRDALLRVPGRVAARPAWWLAAGAAAGLACLSKYSALFLAPGVLLWLALTTRRAARAAHALAVARRGDRRSPIFAPNIAWNASHGWMTFAKQFGRVAAAGLRARLPRQARSSTSSSCSTR